MSPPPPACPCITGNAWEPLHSPGQAERERKQRRVRKSQELAEGHEAIPYSSPEGRSQGPREGKWWLLHGTPQPQVLKTCAMMWYPFSYVQCASPEDPSQKPPLCHLHRGLTGWLRHLRDARFGTDSKWILRHGDVKWLVHHHTGGGPGQGVNQGPGPRWSPLILLLTQYSSLGSVSPSRFPCSSARAANFSFLDEQRTFQGYQNKQWKERWPLSQNKI